jgi:Histidine kinase-, DNA gyrase B-, and HSP90-like ATPase
MDFKKKPVAFSLKDVGSSVIDQISSDIYSGPGSILRELVKNAYDSYLALPVDELDEDDFVRNIVISRGRDAKGVGRITIADNGIGQDLDDLKANVQISITHKADLEHATGFRGLGSWATLGAGSKILITSTKRGVGKRYRLTIDVRRTYAKMGPETTLDDILNDPKCVWFEEDEGSIDKMIHSTVVEIQCDGPSTKVNGYELNRLFAYTDPTNEELRALIAQHCALPFSAEGGAYKDIHKIYSKIGYVPTAIVLDGDELDRRLPQELTNLWSEQIHIGGKLAALVWCADNPKATGEIDRIDEEKHALNGPGIQLCRLNVPIGAKNIFSSGLPRANTLSWFVGEVQIVLADVLPNASGQDLRAGTAREAFIQELRSFYSKIGEAAEEKSVRLSLEKKLKKGMDAAAKLAKPMSRADKSLAEADVAKAVQALDSIRKPKTMADKRLRTAAQDGEVAKIVKDARKGLRERGLLTEFSSTKTANAKKRATSSTASMQSGATTGERLVSLDEFQARLGSTAPQLGDIGLTPQQIQEVFKILSKLVVNLR